MPVFHTLERPTPFLSGFELRIKFWPIAAVAGLLFCFLLVDTLLINLSQRFLSPGQIQASPWMAYFIGHAGLLIASLICIQVLSRGQFRQFGFTLPAHKTYLGAAIIWGLTFGILMTVIDYSTNIRTHTPPANLPLSAKNLLGWLSFEGLFAGTVEEILFRGLLLTYLATRISGRIRIANFDLHIAGVVIALLFCISHLGSFWVRPFWIAVGQQTYAFILAILYAYWYEKSGSLLAPIIGHNIGNFVEYGIMFVMVWWWR